MRAMRFGVFIVLALAGLSSCEDHYSSNPPPFTPENIPPASPSSRIEALFARPDAGPVAQSSSVARALTVTTCSSSPQLCAAKSEDSPSAGYYVVSGSGRGAGRSRTQAMADVYREVRDRTSLGEHLHAEPHVPGDAQTPPPVGAIATSGATNAGDPIGKCAAQLLEIVDAVGEVTLDVAHGSGGRACLVSLGGGAADGGAQCLLQAPERPQRQGQGRRGR
jgi:hypothetical protein